MSHLVLNISSNPENKNFAIISPANSREELTLWPVSIRPVAAELRSRLDLLREPEIFSGL